MKGTLQHDNQVLNYVQFQKPCYKDSVSHQL
jgi:hypothetical protein